MLSIAPMIQWTDRYYRYLMRQITKETLLYTEMTMANALVFNKDALEPFIGHDPVEHPLAVQLGGNDPYWLGEAAYLCESFSSFHEINLNCGCPSNKAKRAGFGAELMLEPALTRELVYAMCRRVTHTEVSVKCRVGVTGRESQDDLIEFIHEVKAAGCRKLILHARSCVLKGLSPAQNRTVPPLQYETVYEMATLFPEMNIVLNGGIDTLSEARDHLQYVPGGVMIGRAAYNHPLMFASADQMFWPKSTASSSSRTTTRREIIENYIDYALLMQGRDAFGSRIPNLCKPLHNFFNDCDRQIVKTYKHQLDSILKENNTNNLGLDELLWNAIENSVPSGILNDAITLRQ